MYLGVKHKADAFLFPTRLITGLLGPAAARTALDGSSCRPGDGALPFCSQPRPTRPCQHQPPSRAPLLSQAVSESLLGNARFSCRHWNTVETETLWKVKHWLPRPEQSPMLSTEGPHAARQPWPWLQRRGAAARARAGTWFTSNSRVLFSLVVLLMVASK